MLLILATAAVVQIKTLDLKIKCPPEISSAQISVTSPTGWTGFIAPDTAFKLKAAGVILGPLRMMGIQRGEIIKKENKFINKFPKLNSGVGKELDKWVICNYGDDLIQAYRLPITTDECAVTYTRDTRTTAKYSVSEIVCR